MRAAADPSVPDDTLPPAPPLRDIKGGGRLLPLTRVLQIMIDVASALEFLHSKGIM
jgi:hypothetical protein